MAVPVPGPALSATTSQPGGTIESPVSDRGRVDKSFHRQAVADAVLSALVCSWCGMRQEIRVDPQPTGAYLFPVINLVLLS